MDNGIVILLPSVDIAQNEHLRTWQHIILYSAHRTRSHICFQVRHGLSVTRVMHNTNLCREARCTRHNGTYDTLVALSRAS